MTRPKLILAVAVSLIVALAVGAGVLTWMPRPAAIAVTGTGKALVGGPFALTDQTGKHVTDADFRGKYMLIYFGYTYCPDICPTELQVMTTALKQLKPAEADEIRPIFITVDPERDTVATMKSYVPNFGDRLIGLTGTPEEVAAAAKAYRIYFAKAGDEKSASDYLMDHTSLVFLMDPQGNFRRVFSSTTDADAMAKGLAEELANPGA